jgi:type 1 glutamine amidotransferase
MKKYVENGGGLVMVHFACGAFQEFRDDFEQLAGRVWMGKKNIPAGRHQHDPRGKFVVKITDVDHVITRGLDDFETTDELYTCLIGDVPIQVLATAVSKRDGKTYPMAFVLNCGKGRVFHCVLGHDPVAFKAKNVAEMYRRGCAWAAGLE